MIKQQFLKFIVIGVLSTIVNYSVFYILYEFLTLHYIAASALGFISGVIFGYELNKNWTFAVQKESSRYFYTYFLVYLFSLVLGLMFLEFLVSGLGIIPELANFLTIGLTTCTNFVGIKFWVFKK